MEAETVKTNSRDNVKAMVITAFFAAITFLGIQAFRIPLPAAIGTPFVHFGHIFVVMGLLLQGGKRGAISGTIGLVVFDILNGYIQDIPQVFIETMVKCLIVGAIFYLLQNRAVQDKKREYRNAIICAIIYGCLNIVIELVMGEVDLRRHLSDQSCQFRQQQSMLYLWSLRLRCCISPSAIFTDESHARIAG